MPDLVCTTIWEGTLPGQLTQTDPRDSPHHGVLLSMYSWEKKGEMFGVMVGEGVSGSVGPSCHQGLNHNARAGVLTAGKSLS